MPQGQCTPCRVVWIWHSKLRLKDAACPECRTKLVRATAAGYIRMHRHPAAG